MGAPQIIIIAIYALSVGIDIAKHGEPKTGRYNAAASLIGSAIGLSLLYWGGFFN